MGRRVVCTCDRCGKELLKEPELALMIGNRGFLLCQPCMTRMWKELDPTGILGRDRGSWIDPKLQAPNIYDAGR